MRYPPRMTIALLTVLALAALGCEKPATSTTTTTAPPTVSPARYVYADSLGAQLASTGITDGDGRVWQVESGASLERWETAVLEAAATVPTSITLALGSNDAGTWKPDGGWTDTDTLRWASVIGRIDPRTCVTVVLPWFTDLVDATYPGVRPEVDQARAAITGIAGVDQVRDWAPTMTAHPEFTTDGIHLPFFGGPDYVTHPATLARYDTVTGGSCP